MSRTPPLRSDFDSNNLAAEIPRPVLGQLLESQKIGLGARVLDVGSAVGSLAETFAWLGIDVCRGEETGIADDFIFIQGETPSSQGNKREPFDAVIVRDHAQYAGDLFGSDALTFTAALLSSLRPGGVLVYLDHFDIAKEDRCVEHGIACWVRHLSCFPGVCRVAQIPFGFGRYAPWSLLIRRQSPAAWRTISVRIPESPVLPTEWLWLAQEAEDSFDEPCCGTIRDRKPGVPRRAVA